MWADNQECTAFHIKNKRETKKKKSDLEKKKTEPMQGGNKTLQIKVLQISESN